MPSDDVISAFCLILVWRSKRPVTASGCHALIQHAHMFTLNICKHMRFLRMGSGKHVKWSSFTVVRLGHPLHWLAVASCDSNAAKRLRKHFAQRAQLPKSTNHQIWDMSNNDGLAMATTQSSSNRQPYQDKQNRQCVCMGETWIENWLVLLQKCLVTVHSQNTPGELSNVHSGITI